jgi:hypothetical protein
MPSSPAPAMPISSPPEDRLMMSLPAPLSSLLAAALPTSVSLPEPLRAFSIVTPLATVKPPKMPAA